MAKFLKNNDPRFHLVDIRAKTFVIFLLIGLLAVIGLAVFKQEWFRPSKRYWLMADTSEGFETGMAVKLSGFRIGKVSNIQLKDFGEVLVDVEIFEEYDGYIRPEFVAKLSTENLIGESFIELERSENGAEISKVEGGDGAVVPEVAAMAAITGAAGEGDAQFRLAANQIRWKSEEAMEDVIDGWRGQIDELIAVLKPVGEAGKGLPEMFETIDRVVVDAEITMANIRKSVGDWDESDWEGVPWDYDGWKGIPWEFKKKPGVPLANAVKNLGDMTAKVNSDDQGVMVGVSELNEATVGLNTGIWSLSASLLDGAKELNASLEKVNATMTDIQKMVAEAAPEVPGMVNDGAKAVGKADEVMDSVRNMWPVRGGVPDEGGKVLRTGSDD